MTTAPPRALSKTKAKLAGDAKTNGPSSRPRTPPKSMPETTPRQRE
jgi:hypothetical protein